MGKTRFLAVSCNCLLLRMLWNPTGFKCIPHPKQSANAGSIQSDKVTGLSAYDERCNSSKMAMLGATKEPVSLTDTDSLQAEEEGFEPPVHRCTTVFKTVTISRSDTPPSPCLKEKHSKQKKPHHKLGYDPF